MNNKDIKKYLDRASASGIVPGLDRMRELCKRINNPQDRLSVIHVAGTNGKGSTSAYLASILLCAGKKIGWYSSPAVFDDREIIRIMEPSDNDFGTTLNTSIISDESYSEAMTAVIEASESMVNDGYQAPTKFELETACAFLAFYNERVDIAIVEVGMGGRQDATNILKQTLLSVITPIGLDHMQYLGSSIYQIAGEKAGIIKPGGKVVTYQPGIVSMTFDTREIKKQDRNRSMILGRIMTETEDNNASITVVDGMELVIVEQGLTGTIFKYKKETYHTSMCGGYQPENAALAIEAAAELRMNNKTISKGIENAVWPGRLDVISTDPVVIYDGAHNTDGAMALARTIFHDLSDKKVYAIIGIYKDKAIDSMLESVLPYIDKVMTVSPPGERGMDADALAQHVRRVKSDIEVISRDSAHAAYEEMVSLAKKDGAAVVIFGTLSLARNIYSEKNDTILAELVREKRVISAPCGGNGTCGKCVVQVLEGEVPVSRADKLYLTEEQIKEGYRLACQAKAKPDVKVEVINSSSEVANDAEKELVSDDQSRHGKQISRSARHYGIAVDIGTTTLATALVHLHDGVVADTRTSLNPQVACGADVITRIEAAVNGKADDLRDMLRESVLSDIETLLVRNGLGYGQLKRITIAGNTTMLHLLQGYPVDGLRKHPFTPHEIKSEEKTLEDVLTVPDWPFAGGLESVPVTILPGISAFVGADIVAGMYSLEFDRIQKPCVLLDLGTNGEIVVGDGKRFMATSTAAGPALEGGNLSHGIGAIRGAIRRVSIVTDDKDNAFAQYDTIGSTPGHPEAPIGICGSGVIDITAELFAHDLMDETGLLSDPYFDNGFVLGKGLSGEDISVTQDDIRQIQMAKAAIRTGLDILMERFGIGPDGVDKLYLAGSFGKALDINHAAIIGLIPEELKDKTIAVGNTSLNGAIAALVDDMADDRMDEFESKTDIVDLANDDQFNSGYVAGMNF